MISMIVGFKLTMSRRKIKELPKTASLLIITIVHSTIVN